MNEGDTNREPAQDHSGTLEGALNPDDRDRVAPWRAVWFVGLVLLLVSIACCGGCFYVYDGQNQRVLRTSPSAYDPVAEFSQAQKAAGEDAKFVAMYAYRVRADGTVDLGDARRGLDTSYSFVRGQLPDTVWWDKEISVSVHDIGYTTNDKVFTWSYVPGFNLGYRTSSRPAPDKEFVLAETPRCSLRELRERARIPADKLLDVRYTASGYVLETTSPSREHAFSQDCEPAATR